MSGVNRVRGRTIRDESGQMAGIEVLPLGALVFVVGSLVIANAWAVVDTKMAVSSAAREATRAYVEAPAGSDPLARAQEAAADAVAAAGRSPERLELRAVAEGFSRCRLVRFEANYLAPAVVLPWIGGQGGRQVAARHAEVVDPLRDGVPGDWRSC